jgi:hypothetical protein
LRLEAKVRSLGNEPVTLGVRKKTAARMRLRSARVVAYAFFIPAGITGKCLQSDMYASVRQ